MTEYYKQHPEWFSYSEEKGEYVFEHNLAEEIRRAPFVLDKLVEQGASLNIKNIEGDSLLSTLSRCSLLEELQDKVHKYITDGSFDLQHAFIKHSEEKGEYVFEYNLAKYLVDHPSAVQKLLEQGVDPNLKNMGDVTLLSVFFDLVSVKFLDLDSLAKNERAKKIDDLFDAFKVLIRSGATMIEKSFGTNIVESYALHVSEPPWSTIKACEFFLSEGYSNRLIDTQLFKGKTSDVFIEYGLIDGAAIMLENTPLEDLKNMNEKFTNKLVNLDNLILKVISRKSEILSFLEDEKSEVGQDLINLAWFYSVIYKDDKAVSELIKRGLHFDNAIEYEVSIESLIISVYSAEKILEMSELFPGLMSSRSIYGDTVMHKISESGDHELFIEYLKKGFDPDVVNSAYKTAIDILSEKIKNLDNFNDVFSQILVHSKDPFYINKKIDTSSDSIYLGIPVVKNFWDTDHISTARKMAESEPTLVAMIFAAEDATPELLASLNGLLLPGGGSDYQARNKSHFKMDELSSMGDIEKFYSVLYNDIYKNGTPLVGMCLGSQFHAFHHNEALYKVEDYFSATQHIGIVQPETMSYFMMLSSDEQSGYLNGPEYAHDIAVKISTQHEYAIANDADPDHVGVYSEQGVIQSYTALNHVTWQFHPEHYAGDPENIAEADYNTWSRQVNIFDNLLGMMKHHKQVMQKIQPQLKECKYLHETKADEEFNPLSCSSYRGAVNEINTYYAKLEERLAEKSSAQCVNSPIKDEFSYNLYQVWTKPLIEQCPLSGQEFHFGDEL